MIGRPSPRLVPDDQVDAHATVIGRVLAGEVHDHVRIDIRRRDGTLTPARLMMSPIRDAQDVIGVSVIARDLTEQVEALATLAASEARLQEGESLAHVGGWVLDTATTAVQWSAELHRIHGIEPADFGGTLTDHLALVHPDDRDALAELIAKTARGSGTLEADYRIVRPGGEVRWLYTRANPAFDGHHSAIGARGICQDVTERHVTEQAMRDAYERERTAAEALRAADRLKDEFLATVSHELRTPLTAIIGFSTLLRNGVKEDVLPDIVARIERNAEEMRKMVERLLDFARLQQGDVRLDIEALPLDDLVAATVASLPPLATEPSLVADAAGAIVLADRHAMAHILGNLLSNAEKFAPPGTGVQVTTAIEGGMAVVAVVDRGPGVAPQLQERVFDRFFQTVDQPPGRRGTGVGLAIVRRYAELLGGRAWCETGPDGGAAFRFTLPLTNGRVR
ncbi:MAG: hypothetical protein NVS1B12_07110 [Acidimicrobiales bacterium]